MSFQFEKRRSKTDKTLFIERRIQFLIQLIKKLVFLLARFLSKIDKKSFDRVIVLGNLLMYIRAYKGLRVLWIKSFINIFSLFQLEKKPIFTKNVGHKWLPFRNFSLEKIIKKKLQF